MTKFYTGIMLICGLLLSNAASAEQTDYQVELLIFSQQSSDSIDDEIWPEITGIEDLPAQHLDYNQQAQSGRYFTRLPKSALGLSAKQASLRRSPNYRVLFHEAWIQPVGTEKYENRVRISGGEVLDNGLYEIDGYVSVERGRYLHLRTNLFHSRQLTPNESQLLIRPVVDTDTTAEQPLATVTETQQSSNGNLYLTRSGIPDFLTVNMNNARRMRSKELHYLDHPLFGVLARITPVE